MTATHCTEEGRPERVRHGLPPGELPHVHAAPWASGRMSGPRRILGKALGHASCPRAPTAGLPLAPLSPGTDPHPRPLQVHPDPERAQAPDRVGQPGRRTLLGVQEVSVQDAPGLRGWLGPWQHAHLCPEGPGKGPGEVGGIRSHCPLQKPRREAHHLLPESEGLWAARGRGKTATAQASDLHSERPRRAAGSVWGRTSLWGKG